MNGLRKPNSSVSAETPAIEPAALLDLGHVRARRACRRARAAGRSGANDATGVAAVGRGAAAVVVVVVVRRRADGRSAELRCRSTRSRRRRPRRATSTRDRPEPARAALIGTPAVAGRRPASVATAAAMPGEEQEPGQRRRAARRASSRSSESVLACARERARRDRARRPRTPRLAAPSPVASAHRLVPVPAVVGGPHLRVRSEVASRSAAMVRASSPPAGVGRSRSIAAVAAFDTVLNRSSNGWPEPRAISVRLSALLASKPSMRAVASATVSRYAPSRASFGRSLATTTIDAERRRPRRRPRSRWRRASDGLKTRRVFAVQPDLQRRRAR